MKFVNSEEYWVNTLEVENIKKAYKNFYAVNDVSFSIGEHECVALLGMNGAGKTSTLKMIYSAISITEGKIRILGYDVQNNPRKTKSVIGIVSQEDLLDLSLTVIENMIAHAICYKIPKREAYKKSLELLEFVGLSNYKDRDISELSGGMRRRIVLVRALINEPKLIILDEPTSGLDIQSRRIIWNKLKELKETGLSILLTSHHMDEVECLADRLLIIHKGKIVSTGTPRELPQMYNKRTLEETFLYLTDHNEEDKNIVQSLT